MKIKLILSSLFISIFIFPIESTFANENDGILGEKIVINLNKNYMIYKSRLMQDGRLIHVGSINRGTNGACAESIRNGLVTVTDSSTVTLDESFLGDGIAEFNHLDNLYLEDAIESSFESNTVFTVGTATDLDANCGVTGSVGVILKYNLQGQPVNETNAFGFSFGYVAAKYGVIPNLTATQKEYLTSIIELANGNLVITGFLIDDASTRDRGFVAQLTPQGNPVEGFGSNGVAFIDNSKIRPFFVKKTNNELVLFGDTPAEDGFETNNFGITSVNLAGAELETFKGIQNFRWSNGTKEGIYREPVIFNDHFVILDGETGNEFKLLKINFNGQQIAGYGGPLKSKLASLGIIGCTYCSSGFALDNHGRILVAITQDVETGQRKTSVIRIETDGEIDTSFGNSGKIDSYSDYGTSITRIDDNKFLFKGVEYDQNGEETPFFRIINQLNRIERPVLSQPTSTNNGFEFNINNYDSSASYTFSSNTGEVIFDSVTAKVILSGIQIGRNTSTVTVSVTKSNFGSKSQSITGYSNFSEEQLNIRKAAAEEAERVRLAEIAAQEREAKRREANKILLNAIKPELTLEVYRDLGVTNLLPEVLQKMNEYVIKLDVDKRNNIEELQRYANNLEKEYRLDSYLENPTAENLVLFGLIGVDKINFLEISSYLELFSKEELKEVSKVQKLINSVNILIKARGAIDSKINFPSLAEIKKIGFVELESSNKNWIYSQLRKAPKSVFTSLENLTRHVSNLQDIAEKRKLRNQEIIAKIRARSQK